MGLLNENILLDYSALSRGLHFNNHQGRDGYPDLNNPPSPYCEMFRHNRAKERVMLPEGTVLWKCTQYRLGGSPKLNPRTHQRHVTEWWIRGELLPEIEKRRRKLGLTLADYTRARLAVDFAWHNQLDHVLTARLLEPLYAFVGEAKYKPLDSEILKSRVLFIGGDEQFCIPDLMSKHIAEVSFKQA